MSVFAVLSLDRHVIVAIVLVLLFATVNQHMPLQPANSCCALVASPLERQPLSICPSGLKSCIRAGGSLMDAEASSCKAPEVGAGYLRC